MNSSSYHHGNVRKAVLDASLALVASNGAAAISTRAVAREVGLSHTAVGKEFGGLQGLFVACTTAVYTLLADALGRSDLGPDHPLDSFRGMGIAYVQFATDHPAWMQLLSHPAVLSSDDGALHDARRLPHDLLLASVRRCMRAGVIQPGEAEQVALYVWSAVHGLAALSSSGVLLPQTQDDAADSLMRQLYSGLRP